MSKESLKHTCHLNSGLVSSSFFFLPYDSFHIQHRDNQRERFGKGKKNEGEKKEKILMLKILPRCNKRGWYFSWKRVFL